MKIVEKLIGAAAVLSACTLIAQVRQDYWDFNGDAAAANFKAIENSGVLDSTWNGAIGGNDAADGAGGWLVSGDGGNFTRKAPAYGINEYSVPATTGRHRLEVDFASWNFDAASVGDKLSIKLNASSPDGGTTSGDTIAQVILEVDSNSSVRIRLSGDFTSGSAFRNYAYTLSEAAGASVAVEFDFDTDKAYYIVDGQVVESFTDFTGTDVAQLLYVKSGDGTDDWVTAASSATIDSIGWVTLEPDATAIEYFTFDYDLSGTSLAGLENSGSLGTPWDFNSPSDVTDGAGLLTVGGDDGTLTRKLPAGATGYVTPITGGRYRLEADFASWDFDALSIGDKLSLKLNETGGGSIAQIILEVDTASSVRIRLASDFTSGSAFRNYAYNLQELAGASAAVEFDFDTGEALYIIDGVVQEVFTDFIGTDIAQLLYIKGGDATDDWVTVTSSISLDSFGLRSVEQPEADANAQELWTFENDPVGAEFDGIANSGVLGTAWNFSGGKGDAANGEGQWLVVGDSTNNTRKVPATDYAAPVTTGKYRLAVDFASWNVDPASDGDTLSIKLAEAGNGASVAQVIFEADLAGVIVKWGTATSTGSAFRSLNLPLSSTEGALMEVEFDFDNDIVTYYLDGVYQHRFTDFTGLNIGQMSYVKTGTWGTAASSIVIEEFGYYAVPADEVIDQWNFSDADGTAPGSALSNNGISLGGTPPAAVAQVSNGTLLFGSDGVTTSLFSTSDMSEDPITSGVIEMSFKVTAASFNNTYANVVDPAPARVGFRFQDRQDTNETIGSLRLSYDPVANQFTAVADAFQSGTSNAVIQTGSPVLLEDVTLRMILDLNAPTTIGSFQAFFTVGSGEEQIIVVDGVVGQVFGGSTQIDVIGIQQQITNGGTNWKVGDTVTVDDLLVQRITTPLAKPVFPSIALNGGIINIGFQTVDTISYRLLASDTVDGTYAEVDSAVGDGNPATLTDTRTLPANQFYRVEISQ